MWNDGVVVRVRIRLELLKSLGHMIRPSHSVVNRRVLDIVERQRQIWCIRQPAGNDRQGQGSRGQPLISDEDRLSSRGRPNKTNRVDLMRDRLGYTARPIFNPFQS